MLLLYISLFIHMKIHCQIYCPMIACLLCVYTPTLTLPMPPHHSPCTCTVSQSLSPRLQTSPQLCASQSPAHHTTHLQPGTGNHSHLGPHLPHHSSKLENCISVRKILQRLLVIPPLPEWPASCPSCHKYIQVPSKT